LVGRDGRSYPRRKDGLGGWKFKQENLMRAIFGVVCVSVVAGLVTAATLAWADDKKDEKKEDKAEKIAADKLPEKIKATINKRLPGAEITSAEKEKEDGKVVYDIELKSEGRKYEMDILEDGTIVEIEKEVASKDVPEAVTKAIEAKYPKSTVKEVMEVNKVEGKKETPIHYEVTIDTAEKKGMEVIVSLDGKKVQTEAEAKKEAEKKKDGDKK
jgi:hypothetical protein